MSDWLVRLLDANAGCAYLRQFGSPRTLDVFRAQVPLCCYEDVRPWVERIAAGEANALFAGRPTAFERTSGSSGGAKLIPYTEAGLLDFQRNLAPWLWRLIHGYAVRGTVYFATSPVVRHPETVGSVPVGLPDAAYLGKDVAQWLAVHAVGLETARCVNLDDWRAATLAVLGRAHDLEFISVWSPSFLLGLLDGLPDPADMWPHLKLVSCWMSAASHPYAEELQRRLPHACFEAKGLMSTEGVVSVPDTNGRAVLAEQGFFEFLPESEDSPLTAEALENGLTYEVILTTASGLYRYRTGDRVRMEGRAQQGRPILAFLGRDFVSDLVGEKLTEAFVAQCLAPLACECLLTPNAATPGYVLFAARMLSEEEVAATEARLARNPHYAYACALGQLRPLSFVFCPYLRNKIERRLLASGIAPGQVKFPALRCESDWVVSLTETDP